MEWETKIEAIGMIILVWALIIAYVARKRRY
jgi:hypothetical protein